MKQVAVALFFTFCVFQSAAQILEGTRLTRELATYPRKDTGRVNRLNKVAASVGLHFDIRVVAAEEALALAQKLNYPLGQAYAHYSLYALMRNINWKDSVEMWGHRRAADSLARTLTDPAFAVAAVWRVAVVDPDSAKRQAGLLKSYHMAKALGDSLLQTLTLFNYAILQNDSVIRLRYSSIADSIAKRHRLHDILMSNALFKAGRAKHPRPFFEGAVRIASESGSPLLQATSLNAYGRHLATGGRKKAGLDILFRAEHYAEKSGDLRTLSLVRKNIADTYIYYEGDYVRGMQYLLELLKTAENAKDTAYIIQGWSSLGTLYSYLGDQAKALEYFLKAESANERFNSNKYFQYFNAGSIHLSIGERYQAMHKYPEAMESFSKALSFSLGAVDSAQVQSSMAFIQVQLNNLPLAFHYAYSSLEKLRKNNLKIYDSWIYHTLARAHLKNNQSDSALYYGLLGMSVSRAEQSLEMMRENASALAEIYAATEKYKSAYEHYRLYITYRDSILNSEVRNHAAVQQYNLDLDKKEAQIVSLHAQQSAQRNLLIGTLISLVMLLAIATLLLRNNRLKQRTNRLLREQKEHIDEKADELKRQKENVELLSEIGRKITASLSVEKIISTAYNNVNKLMDANVFGIGIFNPDRNLLEYPSTYERGKPLPPYVNTIDDESRFGAICFTHTREIVVNDLSDASNHFSGPLPEPQQGLQPASTIFLPLIHKEDKLGVITVQSFQKNAYSDYQLFMLRNIATYAAIALQNAKSYQKLNSTLETLQATQAQLVHSEKMASLGELTAGIAHEIQNPLNFVNNFSEINGELVDELHDLISTINGRIPEAAADLLHILKENSGKILHHGRRADSIVKGMLQHSRATTGVNEPTDINALAVEYLRLSYHGLRAKNKAFNAEFSMDLDETMGKIKVVPQDIGRVLLNLFNNAFQATIEKRKTALGSYQPRVNLSTRQGVRGIELRITDNGNGVPQEFIDKIFQPFFTTKPAGAGTGLGLSLSYDIIKAHGGDISVETTEGEGSEFLIELPYR